MQSFIEYVIFLAFFCRVEKTFFLKERNVIEKNIGLIRSCKKNIDSKNIKGIFAQVSTYYLYIPNREVTFIKRAC